MLQPLIDLFNTLWESFKPFYIINQYEAGIRLRLGKYHSTLKPGLHYQLPFLDNIITTTVVATTINLPSQSLTTKDEKSIVVRGMIKYQIGDVKTFLLDVFDATDALTDLSMAAIKQSVMEKDWSEVKNNDMDNIITIKGRREAKKWGIDVMQITLTDIGQIRSFKLFNDTTQS